MRQVVQERRNASLGGKTIAILATDGFEQSELTEPRKALDAAGAKTVVIAPKAGTIRGWKTKNWGDEVRVDVTLGDANPDDYSALMLPGGVLNPDQLRLDARAVQFVRSFFEHSKPVAAICHAPIMLIEANVLKDRHLTSRPSLKTDIANAGGQWTDETVVVDRSLITSRKPDDIPAFNEKMIEEFADGTPAARQDRAPSKFSVVVGEVPITVRDAPTTLRRARNIVNGKRPNEH